jgi:hypothetical protein
MAKKASMPQADHRIAATRVAAVKSMLDTTPPSPRFRAPETLRMQVQAFMLRRDSADKLIHKCTRGVKDSGDCDRDKNRHRMWFLAAWVWLSSVRRSAATKKRGLISNIRDSMSDLEEDAAWGSEDSDNNDRSRLNTQLVINTQLVGRGSDGFWEGDYGWGVQ